ncbi:MAG: HEPN domain-containing protein [Deltaproteobacteria bacterium]|nr:HEPN domain-containing protein [Deltaproteobacteria bacterium]
MNEKIVTEWIKYADEDFNAGKQLFKNNQEEFKTVVCYHMQQTVEKYLKAYLIANNIEIDKTHDIAKLIEQCKEIDINFNNLYNIDIDKLTNYAVDSRYPFPSKAVTLEDEKAAISIVEQVRPFVTCRINIKRKQEIQLHGTRRLCQRPAK